MQIGNAVPPPVAAQIGAALPVKGTAVELFAGAGGLALGLQAAGFESVFAADIDGDAVATLRRVLRDGPQIVQADLDVDRERVASMIADQLGRRPLALLAGGPPCQGFSTAGSNRLDADPRNRLPAAMMWFVETLRPEQVLFENVAALTWRSRLPWFNELISTLRGLGYAVAWRLIHCEAYGVPQRRRRVVLVATRKEVGTFVFPESPFAIEEPAYRRLAQPEALLAGHPPSVRDAIGDLPLTPAARRDEEVERVEDGNVSEYRAYVTGLSSLEQYSGVAPTAAVA